MFFRLSLLSVEWYIPLDCPESTHTLESRLLLPREDTHQARLILHDYGVKWSCYLSLRSGTIVKKTPVFSIKIFRSTRGQSGRCLSSPSRKCMHFYKSKVCLLQVHLHETDSCLAPTSRTRRQQLCRHAEVCCLVCLVRCLSCFVSVNRSERGCQNPQEQKSTQGFFVEPTLVVFLVLLSLSS